MGAARGPLDAAVPYPTSTPAPARARRRMIVVALLIHCRP
jgi:hypothetical protein